MICSSLMGIAMMCVCLCVCVCVCVDDTEKSALRRSPINSRNYMCPCVFHSSRFLSPGLIDGHL